MRKPNTYGVDPYLIREIFDYDPKKGSLTWRPRPVEMFQTKEQSAAHICARWNNINAGKPALSSPHPRGHHQGSFAGKTVKRHRIIWAWMTGNWPQGEIDHIDGDPSNDRWGNLRDVPHHVNNQNSKLPSDNTSGIIGVSQMRDGRWQAYINRDRKRMNLGAFKTKGAAILARANAEAECGYHANHGRT